MVAQLIRALRTASSERYLLQFTAGLDGGALELHFLANGLVSGTLILFDGAPVADDQIPDLLKWLDDQLLPDASLTDRKLTFTVVRGQVVATFQATED